MKVYQCPYCPFGSDSDYYVRVHMQASHKDMPYKAPIEVKCNKDRDGVIHVNMPGGKD